MTGDDGNGNLNNTRWWAVAAAVIGGVVDVGSCDVG